MDVEKSPQVYFTRRGNLPIVMLAGGDKSSQKREIKRAQRIAAKLEDLCHRILAS
jgi:putative addiction module killer protein